ncbi:MAG TPA: hypothetical protein VLW84_07585 [Terriglobales bacterium]|nr:hypothetical protein [Terriglobales bacterium]
MRLFIVLSSLLLSSVLLLCGLASAQAGFGHGHAEWTPPGTYSEPFVPVSNTPFVSLESISTPLYSDVTVAPAIGVAPLATPSINAAPPVLSLAPVAPGMETSNQPLGAADVYAQPGWSGVVTFPAEETSTQATGFDFGAARFQNSYGAAQLMKRQDVSQTHVYTNPDVERVNEKNGLLKYRGRVEHLN